MKHEIGNRYGRLTVLENIGRSKSGNVLWLCKCDCGNEIIANGSNLRNGHTKSCGCFRLEVHTFHGMSCKQPYNIFYG